MSGKFDEYFRDPGRLYTERWPWKLTSARVDGKNDGIFVTLYGEEIDLWSNPLCYTLHGAVPMACRDCPTAFPDYDDDPRLLMIAHKGWTAIDKFTNFAGPDPTGPVEIPTEEEAVKYCKANGIPVPDWID